MLKVRQWQNKYKNYFVKHILMCYLPLMDLMKLAAFELWCHPK